MTAAVTHPAATLQEDRMRTPTPMIDDPMLDRLCTAIIGAVQRDGRDLTLTQVAVLMRLNQLPFARRRIRDVAADLVVKPCNVLEALVVLEEGMLAVRLSSPSDPHDAFAATTPQGRAWLRDLLGPLHAAARPTTPRPPAAAALAFTPTPRRRIAA